MPPKRKTRAAAKKAKKADEPSVDEVETSTAPAEKRRRTSTSSTASDAAVAQDAPETQESNPAVATDSTQEEQTASMETETQEDHADTSASAEQEETKESTPENQATSSRLAERMKKLNELKRRRATEVEQGNRRDRNLEFQASKRNPKQELRNERKRAEALKLLEKQQARDKGEDYERKQFWKYSAESVEAWEEKMAKKAEMANNGFTDHIQVAHKKYNKLIQNLKPDLAAYAEKKLEYIARAIRNGEDPSDLNTASNSLDYGALSDTPSKEAVDRLVNDVKKQILTRETRSRERKEVTDDISWINEKNRVFNQKIARFYDKYTKEIRENLERGTAL